MGKSTEQTPCQRSEMSNKLMKRRPAPFVIRNCKLHQPWDATKYLWECLKWKKKKKKPKTWQYWVLVNKLSNRNSHSLLVEKCKWCNTVREFGSFLEIWTYHETYQFQSSVFTQLILKLKCSAVLSWYPVFTSGGMLNSLYLYLSTF